MAEILFESRDEAATAARENLEEAASKDRWMLFVWWVDGDQLKSKRVTWDFPVADVPGAVDHIRRSFGNDLPPPPLQPADFVRMATRRSPPAEARPTPPPVDDGEGICEE